MVVVKASLSHQNVFCTSLVIDLHTQRPFGGKKYFVGWDTRDWNAGVGEAENVRGGLIGDKARQGTTEEFVFILREIENYLNILSR